MSLKTSSPCQDKIFLQVFVLMQFDPGMEYRPDWGFKGMGHHPPGQGGPLDRGPPGSSRKGGPPGAGGSMNPMLSKDPNAPKDDKS